MLHTRMRLARPVLFGALLAMELLAGCSPDDVARFRVLFSSDIRGYVEPCT